MVKQIQVRSNVCGWNNNTFLISGTGPLKSHMKRFVSTHSLLALHFIIVTWYSELLLFPQSWIYAFLHTPILSVLFLFHFKAMEFFRIGKLTVKFHHFPPGLLGSVPRQSLLSEDWTQTLKELTLSAFLTVLVCHIQICWKWNSVQTKLATLHFTHVSLG